MFTFNYDKTYEIATLTFKNEFLEIECSPENCNDLFENGYDSAPSNGDFSFDYDDKSITFCAAKHGDGQGGSLTIVLKMTKEIKESLEKALEEWRNVLEN